MDFSEGQIKKLGSTSVVALIGTVALFYMMQALIAVGDVELDDKAIRIVDVTMPERDLELMADMDRPKEEEPPPDTLPPEFDLTPPTDIDNSAPRPKMNFKGKRSGVFAETLVEETARVLGADAGFIKDVFPLTNNDKLENIQKMAENSGFKFSISPVF